MPLLRYLDTGTYKVVTMATTQLWMKLIQL